MEQPVKAVIPKAQAIEQLKNASKNIYFISGLGADERVFRLLKFEGYQPVHIHWLAPEQGELIEDYARRLIDQITSDRPILIGLSFGGTIAIEIAKQIEVEQLILISSVKDKFEIPPYFRIFRWLPLHRLFPFKAFLWAGYCIVYWFFSLKTVEERQLLRAILMDTDAHFTQWAIHRLITWQNEIIPEHLYQIHGSSDRIFPVHFVEPDCTVPEGGHLMILNQAAQISTLLQKII